MDEQGLRDLWHIAFSPKKNKPTLHGRKVIGKFGIGKLATYVLANQLTYICKGPDGVIRRVTMDYGDIDQYQGSSKDKLISELELQVFQVGEREVQEALQTVFAGDKLFELIQKGVPAPKAEENATEFGDSKAPYEPPPKGTWTLVILSDLKKTGRDLKQGVLRRILESALPFGAEMAICINGDRIASSKIDVATVSDWAIGPELNIKSLELGREDDDINDGDGVEPEVIALTSGLKPTPYIEIPGIGRVTGRVRLFQDKISGVRSDERGASNGFHVNVLGRVVNQTDISFGEENLSHAAWARFRMAVRADGLNQFLTTNREQFKERRELKLFRAFLRKVFNKARGVFDSDQQAEIPDGGDLLLRSLGVLSLSPLRNVVSETLRTQPPLPGLFDEKGIGDRKEKARSWKENTAQNIGNALGQIRYEKSDDDSFVKFRLSDSSIVVNREHPFVLEHSRTRAEKELVRTVAMVNLLSDVYAIDIGVPVPLLEDVRGYRDRLMRCSATIRSPG